MGLVIVDVSPSLDGYVAGPGVSVAEPFGDAGLRLHRWLGFEATPTEADREQAERMFAVVKGATTFTFVTTFGGPSARRSELEQAGVLTTPHATHLTVQPVPSR